MKKFNNRKFDTEQTTISQSKEDNVHRRIIIEDVMKKRALQQQVAINTHFEKFVLYRRAPEVFVKCPCFQDEDPVSSCPLCYGEGELPAYQIAGTRHHILFHANSALATANMALDYKDPSGIPSFKVIPSAYNGRMDTDWIEIQPFMQGTEVEFWSSINPDLMPLVSIFYKVDASWLPLDTLEEALAVSSRVKFRLQISKPEDITDETPAICGVNLRYKTQGFTEIEGTSPQWSQTIDRTTLGLLKLIEQGTLSIQCDIPNITNGDFFHHIETGQRFRVTAIDSMEARGITFDWQLRVRRIQDDELLNEIK
ncbi:hypothetical protein [Ewingella americana]|uniref:Uncharacterized protein n=1 Tax=Ewingella americana TaxID=41202 RepID=A0A502GFH9_9GAMM|nr:hypothetical protein [Ewingella americana]TPG60040.1 hypothetical protein EAH77_15850 [Ewingella americana]